MLVAATARPDWANVAFQVLPTVPCPGRVKRTVQPDTVVAPVLVSVRLSTNPPFHAWRATVTRHDPGGPDGAVVVGAVVGGAVVAGVVVGGGADPPPVSTENEVTPRPGPPTQGSKPNCTLVRYQAVWT